MNGSSENSLNDRPVIQTLTTQRTGRICPAGETIPLSINTDDKVCRICLDPGSLDFIYPCKCSGSMKHVHEECLKTWLVSRFKDLKTSKCELCSTEYKMQFIVKRRCRPSNSCSNGAAHCLFLPILVSVNVMLFVIIYLLADKYLNSSSSSEQKAYTIALSIVCLIAEVIIILLMVNSVKEACYTAHMEEWHILNQVFQDRLEASVEGLEKFAELRTQNLKIPKKAKVGKVNVRVPELRPPMTPVFRSGKIVAFSPKFLTPCHNRVDKTSIHELNESYTPDVTQNIKYE